MFFFVVESAAGQPRFFKPARYRPAKPFLERPELPPRMRVTLRPNGILDEPAMHALSPRGLNFELVPGEFVSTKPPTGYRGRMREWMESDIAKEASREFTAMMEQRIKLRGQCDCLGDKLDEILEKGLGEPGVAPVAPPSPTTTRAVKELVTRRRASPEQLHLLVRSPDKRGMASLSKTFTDVKVAPHALPRTREEAVRLHGAAKGANVPLEDVSKFVTTLGKKGALIAPSTTPGDGALRDQLLAGIRALPEGTAVVIPGHIVKGHLIMPDGSKVALAEVTAANPKVVIAFAGCNSGTAPVTGAAVIATGSRITYSEAMAFTSSIRELLPRMPLGEALRRLQNAGPYVGLVGVAFVLMVGDDDKKKGR